MGPGVQRDGSPRGRPRLPPERQSPAQSGGAPAAGPLPRGLLGPGLRRGPAPAVDPGLPGPGAARHRGGRPAGHVRDLGPGRFVRGPRHAPAGHDRHGGPLGPRDRRLDLRRPPGHRPPGSGGDPALARHHHGELRVPPAGPGPRGGGRGGRAGDRADHGPAGAGPAGQRTWLSQCRVRRISAGKGWAGPCSRSASNSSRARVSWAAWRSPRESSRWAIRRRTSSGRPGSGLA